MKQAELALDLLNMTTKIDNTIVDLKLRLYDLFIPEDNSNNQEVDKEAIVHHSMVNFVIASHLNSIFKKNFDKSKKAIDKSIVTLGINPQSIASETINPWNTNVFSFTKRQNKDGETTLVVDLLTALTRAGVEKSVLDDAVKVATKTKRGNIYYEVKCLEE